MPREVLRPGREVEGKFKTHIGGKGDEVVHVVGGEDTTKVSVGTHIDRSYLVAAVY